MKKSLSLLVHVTLFLCFYYSFSQNPNDLPKISPASPEASTLGRFGEIPVNLSVGMTNFSVPIYTINEGGFQLPISLGYQHNGLVVDQIPGHLGMGWSLNAGGMITRQVRSRPDDYPEGYIGNGMSGRDLIKPYILNELSEEDRNEVNLAATSGALDTQPDKFVASAGNMSVTFYFDENRNPVMKPYKPYVIEVIDNDFSFNKGIKIIDDSGTQYFFQDIEKTKQIIVNPGEISGAFLSYYPTGWKLSKVITTSNDTILLSYDDTTHFQKTVSQSFSERQSGSCSENFSNSSNHFRIDSKLIKNITFPKGEIQFNNTIVITTDGLPNRNKYLSYLNQIELKNLNNKTINTFDLTFDNTNKTRKLLTEVKVNNDNSNKYSFEYYGEAPDDIHFSQQDFWGYYNTNPTNFLVNSFNSHDIYGGRVPDFNKTILGALKKITYPTKGSTKLEYQANTFNPEDTDEVPYTCQTAQVNTTNSKIVSLNWEEQNEGINSKEDQFSFEILEGFEYADISFIAEKISPNGCGNSGIPGSGNGAYGKVDIIMQRLDGGTIACQDLDCYGTNLPSGGCEKISISIGGLLHCDAGEESISRRFKLLPGTYYVYLGASNPNGVNFGVGDILRARANVATFQGSSEPSYSVETGGLRIAKLTNCPSNSTSGCVEKEFVYETNEGVSQGNLFRKRNILSYDYISTINGGAVPCSSTFRVYSSSSNVPLGFYMGSHVFYNTVIEKTKDINNNSLGYIEKTFKSNAVQQSLTFPFISIDNKEFINGKKLSEKTFNNTSPVPLIDRNYDYDFGEGELNGINQEVYSLSIGVSESIINSGGTTGQVFNLYKTNVTVFRNQNDRDWLKEIITKEHLRGSELETVEKYEYSNPQSHLKKEIVTDSDDEVFTTNYSYPYDISNATNNLLVSKNRLVMPVEVKVNKIGSTDPLSKQVTEYRDWGNNIIAPEFIKSSKGADPLENRLQYYRYDNKGNPLELSKSNGASISYIWGYNQEYLVAKIENLSYSDIEALPEFGNGFIANEGLTQNQENALRRIPNTMVTTYTHDPLVGVISMTNPKGEKLFYEYDDFNRLLYVKDLNEKVLEDYNYNYRTNYESLSASMSSSSNAINTGDEVSFQIETDGGSGNYTYKWTISNSNLNEEIITTTNSYSVTTTSLHKLNFNMSCEVTDTVTNEVISLSTSVSVTDASTPLIVSNITSTPNSNISVGDITGHSISVSGGSGQYRYRWTKSNNTSNINLGGTTSPSVITNIIATDCPSYSIKCVVTDTVTNQSITRLVNLNVNSGCPGGQQ